MLFLQAHALKSYSDYKSEVYSFTTLILHFLGEAARFSFHNFLKTKQFDLWYSKAVFVKKILLKPIKSKQNQKKAVIESIQNPPFRFRIVVQ